MDRGREIRILIIEDEPAHAAIMRKQLEDGDPTYKVTVASTGEGGIKAFRQDRYALVLLDYYLPDGDGLMFLDRIRAIDRGVPIVIITAEDSAPIAVHAMKRGASDYMVKEHAYTNLVGYLQDIWAL